MSHVSTRTVHDGNVKGEESLNKVCMNVFMHQLSKLMVEYFINLIHKIARTVDSRAGDVVNI